MERRAASDLTADPTFQRLRRQALATGGVGALLCLLGLWLAPDQFFQAYLFAYLFWLGITLGSLVWALIYYMTGGRWGFVIRNIVETTARLAVLMAVLFLPLYAGLGRLYAWARPETVAADPLLQHKQAYLNVPFFTGRSLFYFAIWIAVSLWINHQARRQEEEPDRAEAIGERLRRSSGPALALFGLTVTFAAIDWGMSLEPHWYSTIYGMVVAASQALTGLAFTLVVLQRLAHREPLARVLTPDHWDDLGKFFMAMTLLWAYLTFAEYLIIWSANLPEEVVHFLDRLEGGWQWVSALLLLGHFAVPFALLLSGRIRRSPEKLSRIAIWLLGMDLVYLYWLVIPAFYPGQFHLHWLHVVTPVAMGGIWLAVFLWQLAQRPLLPRFGPGAPAREQTGHGEARAGRKSQGRTAHGQS
ncbi:MAG: membrane protein [Litorilinea sp.]|nr:MAG: membrane protein [Litorilinea sp.]